MILSSFAAEHLRRLPRRPIPEASRRLAGDRVALCGNVNCGLLQTGTDKECIESARYSLREGMQAPGYIFCTSNCIYTGMDLARYELILDVWRREGNRPAATA